MPTGLFQKKTALESQAIWRRLEMKPKNETPQEGKTRIKYKIYKYKRHNDSNICSQIDNSK